MVLLPTKGAPALPLPAFFPDATQGVVKTLDSHDIRMTGLSGLLVNTYHLYRHFGSTLKPFSSVKELMSWDGAVISDSGGFQIMSIIHKTGKGEVADEGAVFQLENGQKTIFTPELSIKLQLLLGSDVMVVLDDFTPRDATKKVAASTVNRTILWAERSKTEFTNLCRTLKIRSKPKLIGVVQGGKYQDLRQECAQALNKIGFDGLGFGGWPVTAGGSFDIETAKTIADCTQPNSFLYGLGIGKPEDIVRCASLGYDLFDCVLPTRDARHGRLYIFHPKRKLSQIDFYTTLDLHRKKHLQSKDPLDSRCDCLLCRNYSLGYLTHLFRLQDPTAFRLATIHNLRFYSRLMERIRQLGRYQGSTNKKSLS